MATVTHDEFSQNRFFGGFLVCCSEAETIRAVLSLLEADRLGDRGKIPRKGWKGAIRDTIHFKYKSDRSYSRSPDLNKILDESGGRYHYHVYVISIGLKVDGKDVVAILLLFPFSGLSRELNDRIHEELKGKNARYAVLDIEQLLQREKERKVNSDGFDLRRVVFDVNGDVDINHMTLQGKEIANTKLYAELSQPKKLDGLSFSPKVARIAGHFGRQDVGAEFDRFGNCRINVGKNADRLGHLIAILASLSNHGLLRSTQVPPSRRKADEFDDGQAETTDE